MFLAIFITLYVCFAVFFFVMARPTTPIRNAAYKENMILLVMFTVLWPMYFILFIAMATKDNMEANINLEDQAEDKYQQLKDLKEQIRNINLKEKKEELFQWRIEKN